LKRATRFSRRTARYAQLLERDDAVELLQQTLAEEEAADQKLTALGEGGINQAAMAAHGEEDA
jgi:ferritin-like metal-binding protein YciE